MLGRVTNPATSAATTADPAAERESGLPAPPLGSIPGHPDLTTTPEGGLDDAEVARRRAAGHGNAPPPPTTRTYAQILRENIFTFVNNILFALGLALVAVGRPIDALVSLTVISTNVIVGIVQEIRAKRTLDRIALLTRPTATAVRAGEVTEVRPEDLVLGDLIAVKAGDQIVLDGRLVAGDLGVDESQLTGESDVVRKRVGDPVFSGSYATTGGGRYVAETVSSGSFANRITAGARSFRRVITPLQAQINLVIRVVLGIVIYLEILLVLRGMVQEAVLGDVVADATLLAGLVPNGLFVSIAVAYALGAIRILRFGALVQQANSIESLSHVDVLCLDKTGTLTANRLEVDVGGRARRGLRRRGHRRARGPRRSRRPCATTRPRRSPPDGRATRCARRPRCRSRRPGSGAPWRSPMATTRCPGSSPSAPRRSCGRPWRPTTTGSPRGGRRWTRPRRPGRSRGCAFCSWRPTQTPAPCRRTTTRPRRPCPVACAPWAWSPCADELRAEAGSVLASFAAAGVAVKIISGDDPDTVVALARQAGIVDAASIAGHDLDDLDELALGKVAEDTTVFGRITPAQKERLVGALRARGHYVAMIGDGVNDVLSLKKANLAIAMGSGSQATRGVADLVLMEDSFGAVAQAVQEGQRILNGMEDILKLFLTRIATVGLVIVSSLVVITFPIELRNASALTVFTVGIPSALLALWAQPGHQVRDSLDRTLARFVVPAAVVSSLVGLLVFYGVLALSNPDPAALEPAAGNARTALTSFLVFVGLFLIVFVEPPIRWFAVAEPITRDRRPTYLAIGLGFAFVAVLLLPPARAFFQLIVPAPRDALIVILAVVAWVLLVRTFWAHRVVDRFLGRAPTRSEETG